MKRWAYPGLAFLSGAAVTIFEFAAPSLFRGYFGQTIYVWANVIGVILGALALGYALGGRWADRTRTVAPLAAALAFAGGYGLCIGWFGPAFCHWLAGPDEYTQGTALRAFVLQSLAASLLLFGPPLVALGMATPLMVQRAARTWPVGRAAGVIFAVGTVGSIAGIYLTTFLFLEWMGVRATITVASVALIVLAAVVAAVGRRRRAAAALLIAAAVPAAGGWGTAPPWGTLPPAGSRLVLAVESPYQLIRVVDRPPGEDGQVSRWLAFDEGMGTYHSILVDADTRWTGAYYDPFARLPEWLQGTGKLRICIVGNAAGTMSRLLHVHHEPDRLEIDGVEIDPAVTDASRRALGLGREEHPNLRVHHEDGRTFLRRMPEGHYDAIVLDAYAHQVSLPAALATREFFALAKSRLRKGGLAVLNLGALRHGSRLVDVVADTVAAGFEGPVYRCPLHEQANVLIVAARGGEVPPPPPGMPLGVDLSFARHRPTEGLVLTDDYCPVESLTARDLLWR
ncbi:MAG: fused MFS/spermidine synthase [Planctomycetota bacterium]